MQDAVTHNEQDNACRYCWNLQRSPRAEGDTTINPYVPASEWINGLTHSSCSDCGVLKRVLELVSPDVLKRAEFNPQWEIWVETSENGLVFIHKLDDGRMQIIGELQLFSSSRKLSICCQSSSTHTYLLPRPNYRRQGVVPRGCSVSWR
jgi:hypothetical protein